MSAGSLLAPSASRCDWELDRARIFPWFSHGGSSDLRYWEPQRKVFGARYRFVAYSRRFHGSGARPADGDDSGDAHKNDLLAIMRRLKAGPVHLVGFSTAIALRSTLDDPGLVRSLTIIQPNVPWLLDGDPEGETVLTWWRDENERARVEAAGDAERGAKLWFELVNNRGPNTFDAQPEPLRRMWLDNFNARRPAAPSLEPLTCEQLGAITTPTLAVAAEYGMPLRVWTRPKLGAVKVTNSRGCSLINSGTPLPPLSPAAKSWKASAR
jgi:pimeloyl-ACP methyl ester carboxylesterase